MSYTFTYDPEDNTIITEFSPPSYVGAVVIPVGCLGPALPRSDLVMSPGHCVQVDAAEDLWLPAWKCAKLSPAVQQIHVGESVTYYNLALPNYFTDNLVVFDGIVVESMNPRHLEFNKEKGAYSRRAITPA